MSYFLEFLDSIMPLMLMVVEIMAAEYIFGLLLERRSFFWVRYIGALVVCISITVWTEIIYFLVTGNEFIYGSTNSFSDSLFKIIYYFVVFGLTVCGALCSYKASVWLILFYCSGGYAAQHLAVNLTALFRIIPSVGALLIIYPWLSYIFEILFCAAVYAVLYFLCVRNREPQKTVKGIIRKLLVSLFVIIICIGISRITVDDPMRSIVAYVAESVSAIVNCVLILFILFSVVDKDKAETEVEIIAELLHREKEQYRMSKENIDLINIKCHDLKHQIKALRENASEDYIRKVEDAVMFYDAVAKTGNDVLDVILTEKTLLCEKNKICFSCVANGEELSFMDNMDIYSLFGNALSNAIEEVRKIEDENRRCVSVNVGTTDKILSVHIDNYYDSKIEFKDGFPVTTKGDDWHGFGMKSMDYIAKKYGGCMSISVDGGIFMLDFIFPLPEGKIKV